MRLDMTGFPPDFLSGRFIVRYIVLPLVENESLQLGLIGLIDRLNTRLSASFEVWKREGVIFIRFKGLSRSFFLKKRLMSSVFIPLFIGENF